MTTALSRAQLTALMTRRQVEIMDRIKDLADLEKAYKTHKHEMGGYYERYKRALTLEAQELIGR